MVRGLRDGKQPERVYQAVKQERGYRSSAYRSCPLEDPTLGKIGNVTSVYSSEGVFGAAIAYSQEIIWKTNCKFLLTHW